MQSQSIHCPLSQAGGPELALSLFREHSIFLELSCSYLGFGVVTLSFSTLIKALSTSSESLCTRRLPAALSNSLLFTTLKKIWLIHQPRCLMNCIPWTHRPAPVPWNHPVSPSVGNCPFIPSFCALLFNIINAHRDPFLLSYDCLVFVSAFGEGLCKKLFRN